jgi:ABC-type lipoprotein export system ATPase subunit
MTDFYDMICRLPVGELTREYPLADEFLMNYRLQRLNPALTLLDALAALDESPLGEFGIDEDDLADALCDFLAVVCENPEIARPIQSITVLGGHDKDLKPENETLTVSAGEVVSVVGPTGSGKSRLLADIECAARGDTPTGRRVLFDGAELDDERRFSPHNRRVAQLSQNMNFVMDLTVEAFLHMHARCRGRAEDARDTAARCFRMANDLSGEPFGKETKVTQLSGGQSRALMIADAACMSFSPILLIDEIENAGIDRLRAIRLLSGEGKIILLSTHDPLLAVSSHRRVVLKNGGIFAVLHTSAEEKQLLRQLEDMDQKTRLMRESLRAGSRLTGGNTPEAY